MDAALRRTFQTLAASANPAAVDVLIRALNQPDDEVRAAALAGLLKKNSHTGNIRIIREFPRLTSEMRVLVEKQAGALGRSLKQVLSQDDPEMRGHALEMVRWLEDTSQIPVLVHLLKDPNLPERDVVGNVLKDLISRLYEQIRGGQRGSETQRLREQALAAIEIACLHFDAHGAAEIVEAAIVLSEAASPLVHKVLRETPQSCRNCAAEVLFQSVHPGVMSMLVDSMSQNFPLREVFAAFEGRDDPEFIAHMLASWPCKLSPNQQKNFREITTVLWLDPERLRLETVPPGLHRQLIAFLLNTGVPLEQKLPVLEWMVRFGSLEGRQAATDVLVDLEDNENKVTWVVLEGLEADAPDVQAWATHQLRSRHIPDAFRLLIERLDSPVAEVRAAARAELGDFDILRVLGMYDQLDPTICVAVGRLLLKIDPDTPARLRQEMLHAIRRKRIRAARGALALRLHQHVADALLEMSHDSDNLVRRTAAEVLGHVGTPESALRLKELRHDPSPRLREVAAAGLRGLREVLQEDLPDERVGLAADLEAHAADAQS